jgi:hypothetical protein
MARKFHSAVTLTEEYSAERIIFDYHLKRPKSESKSHCD